MQLRTLLAALAAAAFVTTPVAAWAQDDDDEDSVDVGSDEEEGADDDGDGEGESDGGGDGWGSGGDDDDGAYKPGGKTGKLKELEEKEREEREAAEGAPDLPPPGFISLDTVIGFGEITVPTQAQEGGTDTTVASFLMGVGYRIGDTWQIYARFPISTAETNGQREPILDGARDPDMFKQIATGSLELGVKPHFIVNRDLRIPVGLAILFPSGQGDFFPDTDNLGDQAQAITNEAAAASRGWEERGLFAYQRFTLTPSVGALYQIPDLGPGKLRLGANTKLEIMIRTGGSDPIPQPDFVQEYNDVSINWVTGGEVWYDLFDGLLSPGLRLWLAVATPHQTIGTLGPDGAQFVFEPSIATHASFLDDEAFGMDARVGAILPAGGELGGDNALTKASIVGLRISAGFFF